MTIGHTPRLTFPQQLQRLVEVRGQGGAQFDRRTGFRVAETQLMGVKEVPVHQRAALAVDAVTDNGMAKVGEVDPDLMGAARLQGELQ